MTVPGGSGEQRPRAGKVETPCINVCVVDRHGYCSGCRRSLDEIARWGSMTAAERQAVMSFLPGRVAGGPVSGPGGGGQGRG